MVSLDTALLRFYRQSTVTTLLSALIWMQFATQISTFDTLVTGECAVLLHQTFTCMQPVCTVAFIIGIQAVSCMMSYDRVSRYAVSAIIRYIVSLSVCKSTGAVLAACPHGKFGKKLHFIKSFTFRSTNQLLQYHWVKLAAFF